jgi:hypothetical protein
MKTIMIMFVAGLLTQQVTQAQGTITYLSNVGQTSTGSDAVGSDSWLAADLITGNNVNGYILDSVQLAMTDASGNPSGFTAMIYGAADTHGAILPASSLGTLDGSLNPATGGVFTYTPASSLTLLPNTDYFIVLTAGTAVANGAYEWSLAGTYSYNASSGWGVGSNEGTVGIFLSSHNGLSWSGNEGNLQFAINATPIPEPSSSFLLLLGSGVFIYVSNRKRHSA